MDPIEPDNEDQGQEVLYERRGAVGWVTLNRPQAHNSINDAVRRWLPRRMRQAENDPEVRVIVVRGAGDRAFCAGADIKEFRPVESPIEYRQERLLNNWIRPFDEARKPIVAAIHGHCLGGGLEMALACDIRIASTASTFGLPETGMGMITGVGGSQRLVRIVGLGRALHVMLTGERMTARQAMEFGIVTALKEPAGFYEEAAAFADAIAAKAPLATRYAKEVLRAGTELDLESGLRLELDLIALLLNTEDRMEAARAFTEKRAPRFVGR